MGPGSPLRELSPDTEGLGTLPPLLPWEKGPFPGPSDWLDLWGVGQERS